MNKRTNSLLAILLLGTVLRLLWIKNVDTQPVSDFKHYHDLAMSILHSGHYWLPEGLDYIKQTTAYIKQGVHYPTAFRPPGYPIFLVLIYAVWPNIVAAKLANVVLSMIWMLCTYWFVKRYLSERVALWATFVTAIFPPFVAYTSILGTEILANTLVMLLLCLQAYRIGGKVFGPLIIGCLVGFLSLVKPYFAVYPIFYALYLWWQNREEHSFIRESAFSLPKFNELIRGYVRPLFVPVITMIIGMAMVISPWTIRNYEVFHRFVPISTNGDFVLYINNNDVNHGVYMDAMNVPNSIFMTSKIQDANGTYNEPDAMKAARAEAMKWILSHPTDAFFLGIDRLSASYFYAGKEIRDWAIDTGPVHFEKKWETPLVQGSQAASLFVIGSGLLYMLLLIGRVVRSIPQWIRGQKSEVSPFHYVVVTFLLFLNVVIFASEGQPRYMFPMYPFFIIGMCWLVGRVIQFNFYNDESQINSLEK